MTPHDPTSPEFVGYTCAHRLTAPASIRDAGEWHDVRDVLDERLDSGAPIITLTTGGSPMPFRPCARVLVRMPHPPNPCRRHKTPVPLASLPTGPDTAPEGER
ncbi:hypothetical protein ACFWJ5_21335 [Streptomyces qaidamensis]|uniref:hypothetical protein n=1 Tax=Streptomyces qaidamensis TaxID=1783515 RepID=UPI00365A7E0C